MVIYTILLATHTVCCQVSRSALEAMRIRQLIRWGVFFLCQVYRCLVESCRKCFTSPAERRQHLLQVHSFPALYDYEAMHVAKRGGQIRPIDELRSSTKRHMQGEQLQSVGECDSPNGQMSQGASISCHIHGLIVHVVVSDFFIERSSHKFVRSRNNFSSMKSLQKLICMYGSLVVLFPCCLVSS
jgi:hypothetical protein